MDQSEAQYQRARAAFDEGSWSQAISFAGQALAADPGHGAALNLMIAARKQFDLATDPYGERRVLTVLMADLVGSTRLPRLLGPEGYREVLQALHAICVDAITTYEGRVAQYLGDGIMAFFSYPEAHADDPRRAVLAALKIVDDIVTRRPEFLERFGTEIQIRIGIDTGLVVVGALGAGDWTTSDSIVGDPPNMASRIQHIARPNTVVVSDVTRRLVDRDIVLRAGRPRRLRGMPGEVVVHRALGSIGMTAARPRRPGGGAMIGRDTETTLLGEVWSAVLAGERRCVRLVGEPGIGKSRLADHLVNVAHASGGRTIVLNCSSLRRHVPFHPVVTAVRRLLNIRPSASRLTRSMLRERLSRLGLVGAELDAALPVLASLLGVGQADDLLPEQLRERTLSALARLVEEVGATAPLLLVVEDLHDADPSTLELLQRIVARDGPGVGILVTSRTEGPELAGDVTRLAVGPLDDTAANAVVRGILVGGPPDQVAQLVDRADGIPLYLEELASWSAEQSDGSAVPVTLSGVLTARLDGLPAGAREVASTAAVIGTQVDHELLAAVSDRIGDQLDRHLSDLIERRVLVRTPASRRPGYRFRHTLLREAAYGRQVRDVRQNVHRRCAEVLAGWDGLGHAEPPAVVAAHFEEGAEPAQALSWWGRSAREAGQTGANLEAIDQYGRALRLLDAVPGLPDRDLHELGLRIGLGISSSVALGYSSPPAREAFERADEIGRSLPASTEWAAAIWGLWSFFMVRGELDRAADLVARARRMAEELGDRQLAATTAAMAGYVLFFQGRLGEACEQLVVGLESRAELLPNDPHAVSRALIGVIEWLRDDPVAADRSIARAIDEARAVPGGRGAFTLAFVYAYSAWLAQLSGDPSTAVSRARSTIALATEHGFRTWQAAGYIHLTIGLGDLGTLDPAGPGLPDLIGAWQGAGAGLMLPYFLGRLAAMQLAGGTVDAALATVLEAQEAAHRNHEHVYDAELLRLRALIRAARGEPDDDIVRDLEEAVRVAHDQGARAYVLRALKDLGRWGVFAVRCSDSSSVELNAAAGWRAGRPGPAEITEARAFVTPR